MRNKVTFCSFFMMFLAFHLSLEASSPKKIREDERDFQGPRRTALPKPVKVEEVDKEQVSITLKQAKSYYDSLVNQICFIRTELIRRASENFPREMRAEEDLPSDLKIMLDSVFSKKGSGELRQNLDQLIELFRAFILKILSNFRSSKMSLNNKDCEKLKSFEDLKNRFKALSPEMDPYCFALEGLYSRPEAYAKIPKNCRRGGNLGYVGDPPYRLMEEGIPFSGFIWINDRKRLAFKKVLFEIWMQISDILGQPDMIRKLKQKAQEIENVLKVQTETFQKMIRIEGQEGTTLFDLRSKLENQMDEYYERLNDYEKLLLDITSRSKIASFEREVRPVIKDWVGVYKFAQCFKNEMEAAALREYLLSLHWILNDLRKWFPEIDEHAAVVDSESEYKYEYDINDIKDEVSSRLEAKLNEINKLEKETSPEAACRRPEVNEEIPIRLVEKLEIYGDTITSMDLSRIDPSGLQELQKLAREAVRDNLLWNLMYDQLKEMTDRLGKQKLLGNVRLGIRALERRLKGNELPETTAKLNEVKNLTKQLASRAGSMKHTQIQNEVKNLETKLESVRRLFQTEKSEHKREEANEIPSSSREKIKREEVPSSNVNLSPKNRGRIVQTKTKIEKTSKIRPVSSAFKGKHGTQTKTLVSTATKTEMRPASSSTVNERKQILEKLNRNLDRLYRMLEILKEEDTRKRMASNLLRIKEDIDRLEGLGLGDIKKELPRLTSTIETVFEDMKTAPKREKVKE